MTKHPILLTLQIVATLSALLGVVQAVLGFRIVSGTWVPSHGMIGNLTFVVALVAAVVAFLWMRRSGNKSLFMHAAGMAVVALAQVAMGEMGLRAPHIAVGVAYLLGAVALATLAIRKPGEVEAPPVPRERLQG
ncbi:hypothetical protein GCM10009584_21850 [Ornithinimicrobium humiphilum]|uniref:Uncharacterized protein n=1 Tax=Ornithinimicrobium humiphilum TaxID=125288 RepID=A0A543KN87_9MICO|nr:hypothetical protein [Ornithinimicrobium humiphilum]TQM96521.1 hypothetical protein FB476_1389 [Ornithinimicrobium humiphilum]